MPETKFHAPRVRDAAVSRPRLLDRLDRGVRGTLTLVAAPAGFGKTTLIADWLAARRDRHPDAAWLSLDPADDEAEAFWVAVSVAIDRALPGATSVASRLLGDQPPSIEAALTALVNELAAAGTDLVIVLDDYHVIETLAVHEGMAALLDRLPASVHVVLATRADPALPLARLRAGGDLLEIRAEDLRFTPAEAETYLGSAAGLDLAPTQVAALAERTEGWIAALQLAALSLDGRSDIDAFVEAFTGDDRFVVDYLAEEVLDRQPADVRDFLLHTCILDRLTGPLCDAATMGRDGQAMLETLDRRNLFVVALDARREWYRYHHLFADVLRARLTREQPGLVSPLHRRASDWLEAQGDRREAIGHALAGGDVERAADLMELLLPEMQQGRQVPTLQRWFTALPEAVFRARPVLAVGSASALMADGDVVDVDARLRDAERWLEADPSTDPRHAGMIVRDEDAFRRLPAAVAMTRAAEAQLQGDRERTESFAKRALDLAGEDDPFGRGGAAGFLALSHWAAGELEPAHDYWAEAQASLARAGHLVDAIGCFRPLIEIRFAQGRRREAMEVGERALRRASDGRSTPLRGAGDLHVAMSELLLEGDDLEAAAEHLRASDELGEGGSLPQNAYRWCVAMADLRLAERDTDGALAFLADAEHRFVSEFYPVVRPIPARIARVHAAAGHLREAQAWVRDRGLASDDEPTYLTEYEHVTIARIRLAQAGRTRDVGAQREALALLGRLHDAAVAGGRGRSVIEILVLTAVAEQGARRGAAGLEPLGRAMDLADAEGFVRVFTAEGPPMRALLTAAVRHGVRPDLAGFLLERLDRRTGDAAANDRLAEPLSDRELEVLRLLASNLDGPGIARELIVALSTVRSHTKAIYAKLGVNDRRAAVRRAEELGLLSPAARR